MWGNRRCLNQEPVRLVMVLTHDLVRVVEERLTRWPRISSRRLSEEIDLRQVLIEQRTEEITTSFIPDSAPVSTPQYHCKFQAFPLVS